MITLTRDICIDLENSIAKEWLVSNGIGGYASGTVPGINTRKYHGYLVAALQPPVQRTVLLNNIDEEVELEGRTHYLGANEYPGGKIHPSGYVYIEEFRLPDCIPTTVFRAAGCVLHKTVWMEHEHNTSYIRYDYVEGEQGICLVLHPMCNYRDYHSTAQGEFGKDFGVDPVPGGCMVTAHEGAVPFWLTSSPEAVFTHTGVWYWNFVYRGEVARGFDDQDDLYLPGVIRCDLQPGESLTLIASTEPPEATSPLVPNALEREQARRRRVLKTAGVKAKVLGEDPTALDSSVGSLAALLVSAADTFIVSRTVYRDGGKQQVPTVLAGYHWFTDWGRDTMISLPGLALPTGRVREANKILRTFAHFSRDGMLPNNFPDEGTAPQYNTADATLWMFAALERLADGTGSLVTARGLFPMLSDVIAWHVRGTAYGIGVDPEDGLLRAGEDGVQLTWMDAKVDGWVVTPRTGKPVEINALWYNALRVMHKLHMALGGTVRAGRLERPDFAALAERARASFRHRFWNPSLGYLYDVVDGPGGDDASLRPNQVFAVSLSRDLLTAQQARAVVQVVRNKLFTPYGLRTLSPDDRRFIPIYTGDRHARDAAYHMGTIWPWLLGAYFDAVAAVDGPQAARQELQSILPYIKRHVGDAGLGSISEIFDAGPPYGAKGCVSQAWSVAEVLRSLVAYGM